MITLYHGINYGLQLTPIHQILQQSIFSLFLFTFRNQNMEYEYEYEYTFESFLIDLSVLILTVLVGIYFYFRHCFKYWKRKGMPYVEPTFPFGSISNPMFAPKSLGEQFKNFYSTFKGKGHKHLGVYGFAAPMYIPIDIELIKNIMQKDFDHFVDRGIYHNEVDDPLSAGLFSIEGAKWRNLRVKLTTTFTLGKMRMMFPTLLECGHQLKEAMDAANKKHEPIDIKEFAACFTTNVIGSCAFGIQCNCFTDTNSEFRKYGKRNFALSCLELVKSLFVLFTPSLSRRLRLAIVPKEVSKFFMKIISETFNYRESSNVERKDFMQLLINIKNSAKDVRGNGIGLTFEELSAQAFNFFVAGYETSSTTMTFCLFELASNPDVQQKIREEIQEVLVKYNGEITYDALGEMKYMGQVIDETLRKHPPVMILNRKCVEPYKVPDTEVVIEKNTAVVISVLGLHRDPEYFPDPEKFDPDRFSEENRSKIIPFTYLPFGEGPRVCI
ncbi:hypothetical protein ILUMI_19020, partial [Ignelater luminosus]